MMDKIQHGGKRSGAGRKPTGITETKVIRVVTDLVPVVEALRQEYKKTGIIPNVNNVTVNQDDNVTVNQVTEFQDKIAFRDNKLSELSAEIAALTVKAAGHGDAELQAAIDRLQADNDSLHKDLSILTKLNKQLKNEIVELKGLSDTAKKAAKKGREQHPYTDKALTLDIANLYDFKQGNVKRATDIKRPAKEALGLPVGRGVSCTEEQNRAIFEWIKENKQ